MTAHSQSAFFCCSLSLTTGFSQSFLRSMSILNPIARHHFQCEIVYCIICFVSHQRLPCRRCKINNNLLAIHIVSIASVRKASSHNYIASNDSHLLWTRNKCFDKIANAWTVICLPFFTLISVHSRTHEINVCRLLASLHHKTNHLSSTHTVRRCRVYLPVAANAFPITNLKQCTALRWMAARR